MPPFVDPVALLSALPLYSPFLTLLSPPHSTNSPLRTLLSPPTPFLWPLPIGADGVDFDPAPLPLPIGAEGVDFDPPSSAPSP